MEFLWVTFLIKKRIQIASALIFSTGTFHLLVKKPGIHLTTSKSVYQLSTKILVQQRTISILAGSSPHTQHSNTNHALIFFFLFFFFFMNSKIGWLAQVQTSTLWSSRSTFISLKIALYWHLRCLKVPKMSTRGSQIWYKVYGRFMVFSSGGRRLWWEVPLTV